VGKIDEDLAHQRVGIARVVGDGVLYFFLADLVVDPALRGGGYGDRLMSAVTNYFDRNANKPEPLSRSLPWWAAKHSTNDSASSAIRTIRLRPLSGWPFGTALHYAGAPPPA
jgi:GNAT superfamily N-acetyltransferase